MTYRQVAGTALLVFTALLTGVASAQAPRSPDRTAQASGMPASAATPVVQQTAGWRPHKPRSVRDYSLIYIDPPEKREVKVHDIVTIIVDEKSEVTLNSKFNRQRNASLKAELKEFMRLSEDGNLTNAAANAPSVDANLQKSLNSTGQMTDREGIRYRIAATIVDVLPNGNIVLEARKTIHTNWDVWEYSLTGVIRSEDINRDNTALSENVANLNILKRQGGKVYDNTKRPWGVMLYDWLSPY